MVRFSIAWFRFGARSTLKIGEINGVKPIIDHETDGLRDYLSIPNSKKMNGRLHGVGDRVANGRV